MVADYDYYYVRPWDFCPGQIYIVHNLAYAISAYEKRIFFRTSDKFLVLEKEKLKDGYGDRTYSIFFDGKIYLKARFEPLIKCLSLEDYLYLMEQKKKSDDMLKELFLNALKKHWEKNKK